MRSFKDRLRSSLIQLQLLYIFFKTRRALGKHRHLLHRKGRGGPPIYLMSLSQVKSFPCPGYPRPQRDQCRCTYLHYHRHKRCTQFQEQRQIQSQFIVLLVTVLRPRLLLFPDRGPRIRSLVLRCGTYPRLINPHTFGL